ncbi:c-type cytochrome [Salipiger mangrovisoli]|uniref:C-type cytochrome n=1 Tax=Salipiger mangrovisoli TaxID=2865933 RepID=A0ABR9X0B1_9RHOB|nr:c-type cytochrome [Salipiger mangrovisoli]MBE9636946.1 c-type cytochrome [Salipiger mangrovisoli]
MKLPLLVLAGCLAAVPALAKDNFVLEDEVALCTGCHGEDGVPVATDYPIIAGQQYFYIFTQLRDFGAGRRENETMTPIAAEYDRDQAKEIAQYFADKPWPDVPGSSQEGDRQLAEKAMTAAECSACHGKWQGDSRIPRLAGQQVDYLATTMLDFKSKTRKNAPDMSNLMADVSDDEIHALARYLSTVVIH